MPVLGYNTAGTSGSHGIVNQYRGSNAVTDDIGGKIKRFHCAVFSADGINKNIKMGIANCAQGDGDPSNSSVIEQVEFEVVASDDEWADAVGSNDVLADTKYYIAYAVPNTDIETKIKYDAVPGCWYDWGWAYADVFPDTLDVAHVYSNAVLYSIWIDYEHPGVLGYDVPGASNVGADTVIYGSSSITDETGGDIQKWHVAIASINNPVGIKLCVSNTSGANYDPSSQSVIEQIEFDAEVSDDKNMVAVEQNTLLADTYYYLGFIVANNGTRVKYDRISNTGWAKSSRVYADAIISPHPAGFLYLDDWLFSIWVDYEVPPPPVANPVFDPAEGDYIDYVDVTITCATDGATIKYTADGSTPAPDHGTEYIEPIHISDTLTLKAIAYKAEMSDSDVVSGVYIIEELWREIIEFDSPITKEIEFDSPICLEIEFESPITLEIEFDSEVDHG